MSGQHRSERTLPRPAPLTARALLNARVSVSYPVPCAAGAPDTPRKTAAVDVGFIYEAIAILNMAYRINVASICNPLLHDANPWG